jgi:hypothetical protein
VAFRCFFRGRMENEKCLALIRLYKSKEVLWNSKSADCHNKSIREHALINSRTRQPRAIDTQHKAIISVTYCHVYGCVTIDGVWIGDPIY